MKKLNILLSIITIIVASSTANAFKDFRPYFQGNGRDEQGQNILHRFAEECESAKAFTKAKDDFMSKHDNDDETITIRLTVDSLVDQFDQEDENGETPIDIASRKVYKTRNASCEKELMTLLTYKANMQRQQKAGEGKALIIGKDDN
jgi:hypothetical protein